MVQNGSKPLRRHRSSLSVRVTIWLVLTAIIPLLATVIIINEVLTQPKLVDQARTALQTDAQTRVQLIDTYVHERTLDTYTLTQVPSLQSFLALPADYAIMNPADYKNQALHAGYSLLAGITRDKNYTVWTIFNQQGKEVLTYPLAKITPRGQYIVPPEDIQAMKRGKILISDVSFHQDTGKATIDIYTPIITPQPHHYLGFMRATLNLDTVWSVVKGDQGSNGTGSYAFILDQNGVRVADTNSNRLFKGVAPITNNEAQQQIQKEGLYNGTGSVTVVSEPGIAQALTNNAQTMAFQTQPAGANETYQAVRVKMQNVPWNYYALSPISTITATANQELILTIAVAIAVSIVVAIIGLIAGSTLGRPILSSVESLQGSSNAMTTLATRQQDAASEQRWVVDSSQIGLQSVQYYTDATAVAARKLSEEGTDLAQRWAQVSDVEIMQSLERIVNAANYIENAAHFQDTSTQKLSTALKVATQVTEQLVAGTTSASDAAAQMEQVVEQLRYVVGK
ncbi:MAG TPA: methyl-accepting chemotaxis protein [Ktedonobacteraceae bacterium]|nr:methyl-accepting chemotaxis protein [Ktedonobacteraceae bacterium]